MVEIRACRIESEGALFVDAVETKYGEACALTFGR